MAMLDNTGHTNGAKKTRQGKGKNTKFGTKPQTHLGAVPKKTLNRYKKRRQMFSTLFSIFQFIVGTIVGIIGLIAIYVLLFEWDKYN